LSVNFLSSATCSEGSVTVMRVVADMTQAYCSMRKVVRETYGRGVGALLGIGLDNKESPSHWPGGLCGAGDENRARALSLGSIARMTKENHP
jgi:hypothetical protein